MTATRNIFGSGEEASIIWMQFAQFSYGSGEFGTIDSVCDRCLGKDLIDWCTIHSGMLETSQHLLYATNRQLMDQYTNDAKYVNKKIEPDDFTALPTVTGDRINVMVIMLYFIRC